MSHESASDIPAPAAAPLTKATVGLSIVWSLSDVARCDAARPRAPRSIVAGEGARRGASAPPARSAPSALARAPVRWANPPMSPPAQKPRPAPVTATTRTSVSCSRSRSVSPSSVMSVPPMALRLSGRFSVTSATPLSCRSSRTSGIAGSLPGGRRVDAWGPSYGVGTLPRELFGPRERLPPRMGTNNVISLAQRRAAKVLAAEVASPAVLLEPLDDETVDEFIERVGAAIAELIGGGKENGVPATPSLL